MWECVRHTSDGRKPSCSGGWSLLAGAEIKLFAGVRVGAGSCRVPFVLRMVFLIFGP